MRRRSSALSAIRSLRADGSSPPEARKLLSFTDNRQDASLQAGHFNDFVEVGLLRSALLSAPRDAAGEQRAHPRRARPAGVRRAELDFALYAEDRDLRGPAHSRTEEVLRDVLAYRIYRDQSAAGD